MLNVLFNRAQETVDNAIGQALNRALVALPFLVGGVFATAALSTRLTRELGVELGYLAMAGLFAVIGAIAALGLLRNGAETVATAPTSEVPSDETIQSDATEQPKMSPADRELLTAALTSAAPIALPSLASTLMRNLPLVAAIALLLYILTRSPTSAAATSSEDVSY